MNKLTSAFAVIVMVVISGCAVSPSGPNPYTEKEAILEEAYNNCLVRAGNDPAQCAEEKDRLLQEQQWGLLHRSS